MKSEALERTWKKTVKENRDVVIPLLSGLMKKELTLQKAAFSDREIQEFVSSKLNQEDAKTTQPQPSEVSSGFGTQLDSRMYTQLPRRLMLKGKPHVIRHSFDILVETANYLFDNELLDDSKIPITTGHSRYLINKEPTHHSGNPFRAAKRLKNGYWIETHSQVSQTIHYAKRLWALADLPATEFVLEY